MLPRVIRLISGGGDCHNNGEITFRIIPETVPFEPQMALIEVSADSSPPHTVAWNSMEIMVLLFDLVLRQCYPGEGRLPGLY